MTRKIRKLLLAAVVVSILLVGSFIALSFLFALPPLKPYCLVLYDRNETLLQAFLSQDGIWRMRTRPEEIPPRLKAILISKEDRFFYYHPGVNPLSILRAFVQNVRLGRTVSGASTITMQVARMLEPKERTYWNKLIEIFRAFQLEWRYSKDEILEIYLSIIPLGGNIEGLKSAALLYYQKPLERLNIAQLFDLILIPNNPNGLQPDRKSSALYEERLLRARPFIRQGMLAREDSIVIWQTDARAERKSLDVIAPHFCLRVKQFARGETEIHTTLDAKVQKTVEALVSNHLRPWKQRDVQNAAVFIIENQYGEVISYVGSENFADSLAKGQVDAVRALRSPGSTLKPLLYAMLVEKGVLTPKTRLVDAPYDAEGYVAENYDATFSGLVYADEALRRSLNTPMIRLLRDAGVAPFVSFLNDAGVSSLVAQKSKLGLSMILGGCGVTLEELTTAYSSFPNRGAFSPARYIKSKQPRELQRQQVFSSPTAFLVTEILSSLDRPDIPKNFESTMNLPRVAFKTGTSYGRRDAWSIGYSAQYTVGVWVGNVNNKGTPDLVGSKSATPLLIDIFNSISAPNQKTILPIPPDVGIREVCAVSGKFPTERCTHAIEEYYSIRHTLNRFCDIDNEYMISPDGKVHFCHSCVKKNAYRVVTRQDYPPELLGYWKKIGKSYRSLPPHNPACERLFAGKGPEFISPSNNVTYILVSADQRIAFQATSPVDVREQVWYLNERYLGRKKAGDKFFLKLEEGTYVVSCIDDKGRSSSSSFRIKMVI